MLNCRGRGGNTTVTGPDLKGGVAMIYHVQARFRADTAAKFLTKLTDGTIGNQRPDGAELVASMERAVVNEQGRAEWSELCYCEPPLAHERATVLDLHFEDIRTEPIEAHAQYQGQAFMEYLNELVSKD
jgi:hypothetical protein